MPADVSLVEIFRAANAANRAGLHTCLPGKVESFDPLTQTVNVKPTVKVPTFDPEDGTPLEGEEMPTIPNVPVVYPRGGGFHAYFPLEAGDHVVLVFSELATGQWRSSGETSEAGDVRRHSLGYPFAIPGAFPDADALLSPVNPLFTGAMVLGVDGDPTGTVRIKAGSVECGGALPLPLAIAPNVLAAIAALLASINAVQTEIVAIQTAWVAKYPLPDPATVALNTAITTAVTALTTQATALTAANLIIPATITKGQ